MSWSAQNGSIKEIQVHTYLKFRSSETSVFIKCKKNKLTLEETAFLKSMLVNLAKPLFQSN